MQKILPKNKLNGFLLDLIKKYKVIAPVKEEDNHAKFKQIKNPKEIYLEKIADVPAKEFFIPENETLIEFKNNKATETKGEIKKTIIFGLRKCDLNAIEVLDKVMFDLPYINKRKNTILIGLFCENPDDYCFCNSMELTDYYDLFLYLLKNNYYISVGSKKGEALVKNLSNAKKEIKIPNPKNTRKLKTKDISKYYKNKIWETDSEKCLSCAACTSWCPTCNCFNLKDKTNINFKNSKRIRQGSSCQLKSFSRVAGDKVFRNSRLSRFKHFVYHKIDYFKKKHNRYMCVGCGRCLRICPTKIDWIETINKLGGGK
ncbi:MAG: 4Fe-4S dicluster domain-containing protein [Candidatus Pacearchaeota archaeon]|jgi:formate hydrogenlyase subunit 6/NADH:ubiquinone oxidoreductase subunit I